MSNKNIENEINGFETSPSLAPGMNLDARKGTIPRVESNVSQTATESDEADYVAMMRETMEQWYSRPRTGSHVTDVVLCPRQRVFKEIDPLPMTDKDLNLFSSGRAIHEAVQSLFMSNPRRFETEK
jgi:hypothetical protein